jgi:hypothetical protein
MSDRPKDEFPVKVAALRAELELTPLRMTVILRGMNHPKHARWVLRSAVQKFLRQNPGLKTSDVYPLKNN